MTRRLAVILLLVAGCAAPPPEQVPEAPAEPVPVEAPEPAAAPSPPQPPEPPPKARKRITIAAVGDMMLGTDYPKNILPDDDGVGFLADVAPILSSADVTFGNLEGVLLDGGEPAKKCSNPNACYLFRSPSRYVQYYRDAGFDVMSLANNHARDFGEEGRMASMQTLAGAGIRHSGLEGDFATMTVNGLKVAVLAYAVTRNSNLLLDYDLARATVAGYAGTHDIVIVSFHGGAEGRDVSHLPFAEETYYGEPRGDVVLFSRMVVDAGADLVIGHGPHVVRAMENYRGRLIAYSLGNFATYYGISVDGIKGIAPILMVTLDGEGNFVEGMIHSTEQIRPAGPSLDPAGKAFTMIRDLSIEDFGTPGIRFGEGGVIQPAPKDDRMTGQELTDLAARYAAAWSSQDPAALAAFYADNGSITVNDGEPSKGREAVRATAESFMTAFPDMKVELVELKGSYPNVEFHWHWTGTNTGPGGTGAYVDLYGYEAWTFDDDGRILQSLGYYDQAEYERQLAQ